jgi:hypothetical protein
MMKGHLNAYERLLENEGMPISNDRSKAIRQTKIISSNQEVYHETSSSHEMSQRRLAGKPDDPLAVDQ